jgi:hypothetical protein
VLLEPLTDAISSHVFEAAKLHADDTPVAVLAPGAGKTRTGRLWVYARDDRASGDATAPAVLYRYSPDRKGEHPQTHLAGWPGHLQADGYAGFFALYKGSAIAAPDVVEVACWAHARRKFFDIWQSNKGPAAREVLDRIGRLYEIEEAVRGKPPDQRRAARQVRAAPEIAGLKSLLEQLLGTVSAKSALAGAIRYALTRWTELTRYLADGRLEIGPLGNAKRYNNIAERALRAIAVGRKNWLFAGSDAGGETAAAFYGVIETAKLNGHNPRVWLTRVLVTIGRDRDLTDYNALLPWVMIPEPPHS